MIVCLKLFRTFSIAFDMYVYHDVTIHTLYIHMYIHTYIHVHTYIHTHVHTCTVHTLYLHALWVSVYTLTTITRKIPENQQLTYIAMSIKC